MVARDWPDNEGDTRDEGSIPGLGRSPGVGNSNPLQYSCLGKSMDRGAWQATVQGLQSRTWLSIQYSVFIYYKCIFSCRGREYSGSFTQNWGTSTINAPFERGSRQLLIKTHKEDHSETVTGTETTLPTQTLIKQSLNVLYPALSTLN